MKLALALLFCARLALAEAPGSLTPTASTPQALTFTAELGLPPAKPDLGQTASNSRVEDFSIITLISLPFTALYSIAAVAAYQGILQKKFPPDIDQNTWSGTAIAAGAGALSIAAVSIQWGGPKKPKVGSP